MAAGARPDGAFLPLRDLSRPGAVHVARGPDARRNPSNRLATTYLDSPLVNGASYYYFVATVTLSGGEPWARSRPSAASGRMMKPTSRSSASPARRASRYAAEYTDYEITELLRLRPLPLQRGDGLGWRQTTNTPRWPAINAPVTHTATVRNRGSNCRPMPSPAFGNGTAPTPLPTPSPGRRPGRPDDVHVRASVGRRGAWTSASSSPRPTPARAGNNAVTINTKSVAFLSYIDASYYESFRFQTTNWVNAGHE